MMEWTTPHFRHLLRLISKKTVLYTEMVVDDTIIHAKNIDKFVGRYDSGFPSVIQIGGSNPETLGQASEILQQYGISGDHYQEINLNCGCPSNKVSSRCFGAKLMLKPALVREIVSSMCRRTSCPVTVKCRLGVTNHRDTYEDLVEFITEAHAGGATKFIVHARDCVLEGLSTKQNREIPPLRYHEIERLRREFPDLTFILNGGVQTIDEALQHMGRFVADEEGGDDETKLFPHGVMVGRAVWRNPLILAEVDPKVYGCRWDDELTRRRIIEQYGEFCDKVDDNMDDYESEHVSQAHSSPASIKIARRRSLVECTANIFTGVRGNKEYSKRLRNMDNCASVADHLADALHVFPDCVLDEPLNAGARDLSEVD